MPTPAAPPVPAPGGGLSPSASAWAAIASRDARYDGRLVYAVSSTGVFCRPSCPSRRPARRHVRVFDTPAAAAHAGFRPCRRCRPDRPRAPWMDAVERARALLDEHADARLTLGTLARRVGLSPGHLQRVFTRLTGLSPREYQAARRAEALRRSLRRGATVTEATYDAGYGSGSRVYEQAAARLGMTPGRYGRGGAGLRVRYRCAQTPLGRVLVAATDRGVCRVAFGDDDTQLVEALRHELPRAHLEPGGAAVASWTREVVRRVRGLDPAVEVPLDVRATAFQWQVWRALRRIPGGATRAYGEVARAVGRPAAGRAVARACASNPAAVVVPCHRVVCADGQLGGYRWGAARKRALLAAEHRCATEREPGRG